MSKAATYTLRYLESNTGYCIVEHDDKHYLCRPPYAALVEPLSDHDLDQLTSVLELTVINRAFSSLAPLFAVARDLIARAAESDDNSVIRHEVIEQSIINLSADSLLHLGRALLDGESLADALALLRGISFSRERSVDISLLTRRAEGFIVSEVGNIANTVETETPAVRQGAQETMNSLFFGGAR